MDWTSDNVPSQRGRTAIVTGANSGLGLETARVLAAKGARVVLACRDEGKAQRAAESISGDVHVLALDLADLAAIRRFATTFTEQFSGLDLLVNNAGVMMPPRAQTADGFELQFGTNHLGHFALTAELLPLMLDRLGARVVTVSSVAHRRGRIDFDNLNAERRYRRIAAYAQSKLANLLFAYELDRRLRRSQAAAVSVAAHPGWTATNLQKHLGPIFLLNPLFGMSPERGALPILRAATDIDAEGGDYYGPTGFRELWGPPGKVGSTARSRDVDVAGRLWERSEALTGARFDI